MARNTPDHIRPPRVIRYGVFVGLTLTVFWVAAPLLAATNHGGWLLLLTAVYSLLLMVATAKAQHESDRMADIRRLADAIKRDSK